MRQPWVCWLTIPTRPAAAVELPEKTSKKLSNLGLSMEWPPGKAVEQARELQSREGPGKPRVFSWDFGESMGEVGEQEDVTHR